MCTFNCLHYIPEFCDYMLKCHNVSKMPYFDWNMLLGSVNQIEYLQQTIIQNKDLVRRLGLNLDMALGVGSGGGGYSNSGTQYAGGGVVVDGVGSGGGMYDGVNCHHRVLQITPEALAKLCDEIQNCTESIVKNGASTGFRTVTRLHHQLEGACIDYITKMFMLMDIERVQAMEDIKAYDMYSCQFDAIEIPPPRIPQLSCPGCTRRKVFPSSLCAYHFNMSLSKAYDGNETDFSRLERMQGAKKASILTTEYQFYNLERMIVAMKIEEQRFNYCIIGHLTVNGIAENRPLVVVGDLIRLRFGSEEVIGEVRSVTTKTESITIMLPIPIATQTANVMNSGCNYLVALKHPRNKPGLKHNECIPNGRFDVRFGLFSMKAHDIFRHTATTLTSLNKGKVIRILAPTTLLDKVQKKSQRRLQVGIAEWSNPLNAEQKHAVFDIVRKNHGEAPYIIYGPPGTGQYWSL